MGRIKKGRLFDSLLGDNHFAYIYSTFTVQKKCAFGVDGVSHSEKNEFYHRTTDSTWSIPDSTHLVRGQL
jgi:hypothetical protein